ncbi:hypothetical protein C8Q73DRAFT_129291 [Cubamyces lactineus]|nr:hypothetical protein C8Q73DRAFT_129291 [Cubamyces lactineus]
MCPLLTLAGYVLVHLSPIDGIGVRGNSILTSQGQCGPVWLLSPVTAVRGASCLLRGDRAYCRGEGCATRGDGQVGQSPLTHTQVARGLGSRGAFRPASAKSAG